MRGETTKKPITRPHKHVNLIDVYDFDSMQVHLASAEDILAWSFGEVTKPETINYRTQRPEKDGLFSERIFGPTKDYECYCGKYKKMRFKGVVCDRCGVEVTKSIVRRERMGHITLASPCVHIWFLRGIPSRIGLLLDIPQQQLERVVYYTGYIVTSVDEEEKKKVLRDLEQEYHTKAKAFAGKQNEASEAFEASFTRAKLELTGLVPKKVVTEIEYQHLAMRYGHIFEAQTGSEPIVRMLEELDLKKQFRQLARDVQKSGVQARKKILQRIKLLKSFLHSGVKPSSMFFNVLPVLPPDLRPMVQLDGGRYASSDLNDLYRRIINRNNRLKRLIELHSPEVIIRNEKRMLQEAVDALIDNSARKTQGVQQVAMSLSRRPLRSLADILKGKQGRFRQNLLGKRVDYSGRSVIVIGPNLKLHQCGIPKKMALEIFKPFVIRELIARELAHNIKMASHMVDDLNPVVWEILEEVVSGKYVLLNRAPTLHRLSMQAFQPVLIEGIAVRVHPLVCTAFNADFDGDQMAVHLPLSEEAQEEAHTIMAANHNLLKPATGKPIVEPTKDIVLGLFWLTRTLEQAQEVKRSFASIAETLYAHSIGLIQLQEMVRIMVDRADPKFASLEGKFIETTPGRIIFNSMLPADFPFANTVIDSKATKTLGKLISELVRFSGIERTGEVLDALKSLGYEYAMRSGLSWGMGDLMIPQDKRQIVQAARDEVDQIYTQYLEGLISEDERYTKIVKVWTEVEERLKAKLFETLPLTGPVYTFVQSGARGNAENIKQMTAMKGLVMDPAGRTIEVPVESSYKEGLNPLEYFNAVHGSRKGLVDTALRTAHAGYLTRRLVDVAQDMVVREDDCGDQTGKLVTKAQSQLIGENFLQRIFGRVAAQDVKDGRKILVAAGDVFDVDAIKKLELAHIEEARIRAITSCKTRFGVCRKCYGYDLGYERMVELGQAVGVVAAQSIGEPGTQLTLKTFHTGGAAVAPDITQGLPRVEEIFELHEPKGKGALAKRDGVVEDVADYGMQKIITVKVAEGQAEQKSRARKKGVDEYTIASSLGALVKKGDRVRTGQRLSEGNLDIKEILRLLGKRAAEEYIIREVKRIYNLAGSDVNDKHVEVFVRQMFHRVRIAEAGDSQFLPGEVVDRSRFFSVNDGLRTAKKRPARAVQLVMGISKVALSAEGFLAAASFQHTSRVLIDAVIEGREDSLRGLKENVIIGKMIPAGTGYQTRKTK